MKNQLILIGLAFCIGLILCGGVSACDLSVNLNYQKSVGSTSFVNQDNIYGTDQVKFTVNLANNGPKDAQNVYVEFKLPEQFKYSSSNTASYNPNSGVWNINTLSSGAQKQLTVTANVIDSGSPTVTATAFTTSPDSNPDNNQAYRTINIHNPVILVHGFNDNSVFCWTSMTQKFKQQGITYLLFDYSSANKQDPYYISNDLFTPYMYNLITRYHGKFDIVCHSMGALVTRFWMEGVYGPGHADKVDKWIGIGAVNQGAAVTDVWNNPLLHASFLSNNPSYMTALYISNFIAPLGSSAAQNMQTTDPEIKQLNNDGIANGVKYLNIVGTQASQFSIPLLNWPVVPTVAKTSNGDYILTMDGDGVVANAQSELPGVPTIKVKGVNHTSLPSNLTVINLVIQNLKS